MGLGQKSGCVSSLEVPPFAPPKFANDDEEYTMQQYDKYTCTSDKFHQRPGCINPKQFVQSTLADFVFYRNKGSVFFLSVKFINIRVRRLQKIVVLGGLLSWPSKHNHGEILLCRHKLMVGRRSFFVGGSTPFRWFLLLILGSVILHSHQSWLSSSPKICRDR